MLSNELNDLIYKHYGADEDMKKIKSKESPYIDFKIGSEESIKTLTNNMMGFGTSQSQRVIIDYDKGFGYFMVKRIPMQYGTHEDVP